jgi:DHA2 family multidrug resistance protein
MFLLTRNTQTLHASIAAHVTPYNAVGNQAAAAAHFNLDTMQGLIGLNGAISNQAAMLAYIDDFQLMMILTLATIPFLFLIKKTQPAGGGHAVME